MLEEVEDTELSSPERSRPAWADVDTGEAPAATNGPRTSPFSPCEMDTEDRGVNVWDQLRPRSGFRLTSTNNIPHFMTSLLFLLSVMTAVT